MTEIAESSVTTRDLALDVAKGLGIILVVIGHAWRGLDSAGMVGNEDLFHVIDTLIYNFHMPLFFLLSGMTFEAWVLKRTARDAIINRVTRLLWPLVLWSYLFTGARLVAGDMANAHIRGWQSLMFFPLPPRDHFWFLWALFLQNLVVLAVIRSVGRPLGTTNWGLLAALVIIGSSVTPVGLNALTFGAATNAGAFLIGLALGPARWRPQGASALVTAVAVFVGLQTLSFWLPPHLLTTQFLGIALSLAFLAALQIVIPNMTPQSVRLLAFLGVSSMGIYLAHTIFSGGMRAVLGRFTSDLILHMVAGTLIGIIGPLIIYFLIRRLGRPSWIGF